MTVCIFFLKRLLSTVFFFWYKWNQITLNLWWIDISIFVIAYMHIIENYYYVQQYIFYSLVLKELFQYYNLKMQVWLICRMYQRRKINLGVKLIAQGTYFEFLPSQENGKKNTEGFIFSRTQTCLSSFPCQKHQACKTHHNQCTHHLKMTQRMNIF